MPSTFRQVIDSVLKRLRMEVSLATQIYSEEAIALGIQHKFDVLFDDFWMPQFMTYQDPYALDGITGRIVGDLTEKVKRFQDLKYIHSDFSVQGLPRAPESIRINDVTTPCVQPDRDVSKVFRILPVTSTGTVYLTYRTKPENFNNDDDIVNMDDQLLILGTCYDMLEDDSTNPGASDKFKIMFDARVKQFQRNQYNFEMMTHPAETLPVNRWM